MKINHTHNDIIYSNKDYNLQNRSFQSLAKRNVTVKDTNRKILPVFTLNDMKDATDYNYHKKHRYQKCIIYSFKKIILKI